MANMRILIRIVFIIFIANGIDCLGGVCDNCCDCFKKIYEEIKEEGNITAESLVNNDWIKAKKNNLVLKIFKKKGNNDFPSKDNGDKISIKSDKKGNPKITYQKYTENKLKLGGKKYALFEIKTKGKNTVYLYCSDVESSEKDYGIFEHMDHVSISVIACNTTNVTDMHGMFYYCSGLTELDLKKFNTTNVTNMKSMFFRCSSLENLDLNTFDTTKVTNMGFMFYECSRLTNLEFGQNFNTSNVTNMNKMFYKCDKLPEDIRNKFSNKNE